MTDTGGHRPQVKAFFPMADRRKRLHRDVIATLSRDFDVAQSVVPALSIIERRWPSGAHPCRRLVLGVDGHHQNLK